MLAYFVMMPSETLNTTFRKVEWHLHKNKDNILIQIDNANVFISPMYDISYTVLLCNKEKFNFWTQ